MNKLVRVLRSLFGVALFGLFCAMTALWWNARESGSSWPPDWVRERIAALFSPDATKPPSCSGVPGTRSVSAPPAPELASRSWGAGFRRRDGWTGSRREDYERKFALIIGVNAYGDPEQKLKDLGYAVNDAREFRDLLIADFGYAAENVHYLSAERRGKGIRPADGSDGLATKAAVEAAFTQWLAGKQVTARDAVIVFFAGHGWYGKEDQRGFLGLSDSAVALRADTAIEVQWVKDRLAELPVNTHRLVILDCCYSGALFRGRAAVATSSGTAGRQTPGVEVAAVNRAVDGLGRSVTTSLADYLEQPAFLGMSAGRFQEVGDLAPEGGEHSPFTAELLEVLRFRANTIRKDHAFTFRQLAAQVEGQVAFKGGSIQIPDWGRLEPGEGDFVFRVAKGENDPAHTTRELRLAEQGKRWLELAEGNRLNSDGPFYAARAVGFKGFGRENMVQRERDAFPVLLDPIRDREERARAFRDVAAQVSRPFVWTSPVGSQHSGYVNSVAWSPDGQTLASGLDDSRIKLWDVASGRAKATLAGHSGSVTSVSWSPDGQTLASSSIDNSIKLWDVETGKEKATLARHSESVNSVSWSPDGQTLASGSWDQSIKLWDVAIGKEKATLEGHSGPVESVSWSPDGQTLASGSGEVGKVGEIKLWDVASGKEKATLAGHSEYVWSVSWSPDGQTLASGSGDKSIKLWDVASGKEKATLAGHSGTVTSVSWSPDGQTLASGSEDKSIKLWDVAIGKAKAALAGHSGRVLSMAWSPDGQTLVSCTSDQRIKLWDVASGKEKATLAGHSGDVNSVSWSPDGRTLASGSRDTSIKLWDVASGKEKATLEGHSDWVLSVAWSPDGQTLASGSRQYNGPGEIKLWEVASGKEMATLAGHSDDVNSVAWSPDGQTLASGSGDKSIRLWEVASGRKKATLEGHSSGVNSVSWSPDGLNLASGSGEFDQPGEIKLWDVASGQEKATLSGNSQPVRDVAWSPDGQTLASCSVEFIQPSEIKLWDVASGKERATLAGHSGDVNSVAWSPDGQTLASGSDDKSIKLWNVASRREKATLAGHSGFVTRVSWSPDGQTLVSGSGDETVKLWDLARDQEMATLVGHSGGVGSVEWSPDGQTLASQAGDSSTPGEIKLWDVARGKEKATLAGHSGIVFEFAWSPDGQTLASGSGHIDEPGEIKLWDVETGKEKATLEGHSGPVWSVSWSPDGQTLASGSEDKSIKLWDVAIGKENATLEGHSGPVWSVSWSPDGQTLASGSEDKSIKLWDVASGREKATLAGHSGSVLSVSWSPDGQTLASGSAWDSSIKLWDGETGNLKTTLAGLTEDVTSVSWSPDGQTLASGGSWDGSIKLWDVASVQEKATLRGHSGSVLSVSWSPDGQTLASGSEDNSIKLWEATVIVQTDLYVYLREGACRFEQQSENLEWEEPTRELYRSIETPFRNVPRWSSLGILHREDLSVEEKDWLYYLRALEAENWTAAARFFGALSEDQKKHPHSAVTWALRTLADQAVSACEAGLWKLAHMRTSSALGFFAGVAPASEDAFYTRLGERFAEKGIDFATAEAVLSCLPDEAARAAVAREVIRNSASDAEDFESVVAQVSVAATWGAPDASAVFASGDSAGLANVFTLALESDHAKAAAYALTASEALLQLDPKSDESNFNRGRALVKAGKPAEAIPFYERALGMTTDEDDKQEITTALEEAREAVQANAPPAPGPVPAPK